MVDRLLAFGSFLFLVVEDKGEVDGRAREERRKKSDKDRHHGQSWTSLDREYGSLGKKSKKQALCHYLSLLSIAFNSTIAKSNQTHNGRSI